MGEGAEERRRKRRRKRRRDRSLELDDEDFDLLEEQGIKVCKHIVCENCNCKLLPNEGW